MNFWWVNHKQTFRQEFFGNYIWSPKLKKNQQINPFYETMREVAPGDVIFSFADGAIRGFGLAKTHCYTSPRPEEFEKAGLAWNEVGWSVDVLFTPFPRPVQPALHMRVIGPTLPERYSPIRLSGHGNQGVYLARIPRPMAEIIAQLSSPELLDLLHERDPLVIREGEAVFPELKGVEEWEERICTNISADRVLSDTTKLSLIKARRGQGLFRERVSQLERFCRVTKVDRPEHLIASHIKPWREANNDERLEQTNGLLLTPTIDHLFDRGFISFESGGELLISPVAHLPSLSKMGIITDRSSSVGGFSDGQKSFLEFHRSKVFLKSSRT